MKKKWIYFWVWTTAEYIKMMPIMVKLQEREWSYKIISTGQNDIDNSEIAEFLNVRSDFVFHKGIIKQNILWVFFWFVKSFFKGIFKMLSSKENFKWSYLFIHGDTLSTMLGGIIWKMFGMKILHVEAWLRSFNWLRPFPEEIDRHVAGMFVNIHYCPNFWASNNLIKYRGEKIDTKMNTIVDAMKIALAQNVKSEEIKKILSKKYFFFTIHRQENIYNESLIKYCVKTVLKLADNMCCVFVLHAPTKEVLLKLNLLDEIRQHTNIIIMPRVWYFDFTHVLANAEFLITDGGSNQEEGFYLGKPTLVLRHETERIEWIWRNIVISKCSPEIIDYFVKNYKNYEISAPLDAKGDSPSEIILNHLKTLIDAF